MSDKDKTPIEALNTLPGSLPQMGAAAPDIDPLKRPLWELDSRFLDPTKEIPPVQVWATMGDRPAFPRKGIITFSAKPKQGKSTSIYAILAPILTGQEFDTLKPSEDRPQLIVLFDTEMDTATLQSRYTTLRGVLGNEANRFLIVPLLETPKAERRAIIDEITAQYNPDIVVIDQVARLVANFNDSAENVEFGEWLATLAAKRSAFVVIHQNKAADNTQMKGHLGSILEELAMENYSVSMEKGIFKVTPVNARQSYVGEDPTRFKFILSDKGKIIDAGEALEQNREKDAERWRNELRLIFGDDTELKFSGIVARIMEQQRVAEVTAKNKITEARKAGAIEHTEPGNNRSPYRLTKTTVSDFEELKEDVI